MSKMVSVMAKLSECKLRKTAFILLEGKTDPKIYEKIINENITKDKKAYSLSKFDQFEDCKSGGCTQIISWMEKNYDKLKNIENILLAFIDGDAYEYKLRLKDKRGKDYSKLKKFIHKLKLYLIESYAFNENCLKEVLGKYLDATSSEIEECIQEPIYNYIIHKSKKICIDLAMMCLLIHNDISIKNKFSYGLSMNDYSCND
ncbi:hypothetical protein CLPUN_08280 [Clostridium puniceum]|uniref:Uncharacterized protein n=1 Tax=Clostridium puniceum TaxID=29367 RepID=A0A1S8TW62_9CLOT|nr:DUF4435 domain-containing protein [Clostridium puniceum]OOM81822.1 hypothetical protein CLPUN_08280 [Clostridium puniceum]